MFLATTALSQFWDTESELLFLGEWCLKYGDIEKWKNLKYSVCAYPWDDREKMAQASVDCNGLYETLLEKLADSLNDIHGTRHGIRYWRIIIGSWLIRYIEALYDRYICVSSAIKQYGELRAWGLEHEAFRTPFDYKDFEQLYIGDVWNQQLYTQVSESLGVKIEQYKNSPVNGGSDSVKQRLGYRHLLSGWLGWTEDKVFKYWGRRAPIWFSNIHWTKTDSLKFSIYTGGMVFPCDFRLLDKELGSLQLNANEASRVSLADALASHFKGDEFVRFLAGSLRYNFPLLYLEGFSEVMKKIDPYLGKMPKVIASATGFRANRAYPFVAAEMSERGCRIITVQHGGSFGAVKISPMELHDQKTSDEYWTWGWSDGLSGKCRSLPSLVIGKALAHKKDPAGPLKNGETKILYCGNSVSRYLFFIWSNPAGPQWKRVIDWSHRWLSALNDEVIRNLLIRSYPGVEYHWYEKERMQEFFPGLRYDSFDKPFDDVLREHDVIVADSNHTVMLKALAMNKPTILFWDPELNELRQAAQPFYDALRQAGILHYTPEDAASKVNEIFHDPHRWWMQKDVQHARSIFCKQFAYTSETAFGIWKEALAKLTAEAEGSK